MPATRPIFRRTPCDWAEHYQAENFNHQTMLCLTHHPGEYGFGMQIRREVNGLPGWKDVPRRFHDVNEAEHYARETWPWIVATLKDASKPF